MESYERPSCPVFSIILYELFLFEPYGANFAYGQTDAAANDTTLKPASEATSKINTLSEQTLPLPADSQKVLANALPKEYLLNNGLKVILIKDKAYPFVSCFTWYKVGSRNDPPGMTGLTHLVEHLLFQNIGNFNGNQWANSVVRCGGEFSGFTSEDFTAFYSNLPTYQLELALRGEAARMRSAHFTKVDVSKEVEHLVKEEKAEEQNPMHMLNREVHALAYDRHPYRNPPGGWRHELERLTFTEAKDHYDKYFYPNNANLVLVGNFDEDMVLKLIKQYFGAIAKSDNIPANVYAQERQQEAERQIRLKGHTGNETIILAYRVAEMASADAPVISVLEQFINSQFQGPLHAQLIDSRLCSSVQAAFEQKRDPGLFLIKCTGISPNGSDKVMQILDSCLNQLRNKQLSDADVHRLVKQTEFAYYCDTDGPYRYAFQTGLFSILAKTEEVRLWPKRVLQVKPADILRVAKSYLNDENRVLGHIAVTNANLSGENNKTESSLDTDLLSFASSTNQTLKKSLSDNRFRLAAYETGVVKPFTVPVQNTSSTPSMPVATVRPVADGENSNSEEAKLQYKVLRNGLRVIVLESHLNPFVQIYGSLKAGSIYERPDARGISKLLAELLDSGSMRMSKQQSIITQSELGLPPDAMLKFDPGLELITFHSRCLSEDFASQIKQLFSCLMEPRLQNSDFEEAKADLATVLRRGEKLPEARIDRALLGSLIASNCAYYPIHPEEEINSLGNFKLSDLVDFYHERVNPANTTILICGDVKPIDVVNSLDQLTEGWILNTQLYGNPADAKNQRKPELVLSNRKAYKSSLILPDSNPAEIVFGRIMPLPGSKQIDTYWAALSIADCALSSHPIFSHIIEQYNLKPELFADLTDNPWNTKIFRLEDKLLWSLNIHLLPKSSSSATVGAVQNVFLQFCKCGLRQEEVSEAKKYLIGSIPVKECSNLEQLTRFEFHGITELNEIAPIIKMQKTINSLKYEDINEFIAKVFKPESSALIVAGPRELIKQVRPVPQSESSENNSD